MFENLRKCYLKSKFLNVFKVTLKSKPKQKEVKINFIIKQRTRYNTA